MTQQKGETMPEVESRSNMKRKAVLRGESIPKDEGPPPEVSHYEHRAGRGYLNPVMQPSEPPPRTCQEEQD